jgi:hypothetical protein
MGSPAYNPQALLQTALVDTGTGMILRNQYPFFTGVQNLLNSSYLPVFSAVESGADPTGVRDSAPGIIKAWNAAQASGGGVIWFNPGTYSLLTPIVLAPPSSGGPNPPVTFMGAGRATKFLRGANMPAGQGMFDVTATDVTFSNFLVDGAVTTPQGVVYADVVDPRSVLFTQNSSFWVHSGSSRITWSEIVSTHTGGYSAFVDADTADITDLFFYRYQMENNRPFLFGLTATDCNYGAWPGGVFFSGNGVTSTAMVRRARFLGCSARRVNGTAFWLGHLSGFSSLHEDIQIVDTFCEDIGRDPIQPGGVVGMVIDSMQIRRPGYVTYDDTSQSTPRWLSGQWAVGVDCGVCYGMLINNVHIVSPNGGGMDIDGCQWVTISNFSIRVPLPTDPEYIEDQVGLAGWAGAGTPGGPNAAYGILLAQAYYNVMGEGGHEISAGQIVNCSNGAVKIYGSQNSNIHGLNIYHPAAQSGAPIQLGNLSPVAAGPGNNGISKGNTISGNRIQYAPATALPCVNEVGGEAPYTSAAVNMILGNPVVQPSNAVEFSKDPASGSIGSVTEAIDFSSYTGTLTVTNGFITGS